MSAYRAAQLWAFVSAIIWLGGVVVLFNLVVPIAAVPLALVLMLALTWVSYDVVLCPRCGRSIFTGRNRWVASGAQKRCSRCDLDLIAHKLQDRRFKEGS
ncbi:hypothetical protein ACETK8_07715 [Brevundimonas staleyi]|uniref:Uncharacterized protein n=1 Tax=Brevundimonas staleyi TaxID=74326 RepID=A0ABW0FQ06_9CAUL